MAECTFCRDGIGLNEGSLQFPAVEGSDPPLCALCAKYIARNNARADKAVAEDEPIKYAHLRYGLCPDEGNVPRWMSVGRTIRFCVFCHRSSRNTPTPP